MKKKFYNSSAPSDELLDEISEIGQQLGSASPTPSRFPLSLRGESGKKLLFIQIYLFL